LHRNAAGYYEFAHKSLAEYFVAFKFAAELGCLAPEFKKTYCEAEGKPCDIPLEQKEVTGLAETFGALVLNDERMKTIWNLFQDMIAKDSSKKLWKVIDETRGKTEENVKYSGGNAATLLSIRKESFKGANFGHTVLIGADLSNTDLTGANFQGACLRKASLINSIMDHSNFCLADLQDTKVGERHHVMGLIWSNSGSFLAGFRDGALIILNVQNNQEEFNLPKVSIGIDRTAQFVPYEDRLLYAKGKKLMAAILKNGKWEIETEREFEQRIGCIALNSDGNLLAVLQKNKIIIWNRQTQKEHRIIKAEDDTHSLLFIPYSSLLVAAHSGGGEEGRDVEPGFKVWDIELDKVIHTYDNTGDAWARHDFVTDKLGHILVTDAFNMNLIIWSLPSFDIIRQIPGAGGYFAGRYAGSNAIACSPDGTTIAVVDLNLMNGEIKDKKRIIPRFVLIDVDSGGIKSLNYSGYISSPAFSPNGNYIASAGQNGVVYIWDISPASSTFAQCLKVLEKKMSCHGMLISGAHGLEQGITLRENGKERKGMLLELFADCGAVLDEEQKRNLKEMRKQRNEE
jgi:WD40 repeat protein